MDKKRKKKIIVASVITLLLVTGLITFSNLSKRKERLSQFYQVTQGLFEVTIEVAGELSAERSVDISGPVLNQNNNGGGGRGPGGFGGGGGRGRINMQNLTILDLVPEGTIVKQGDYVAQMDQSSFQNTLSDAEDQLRSLQQDLELAILDTSVTFASYAQQIVNGEYAVEEAAIAVEMAQFEAPATIRKRQSQLDKAQRSLEQTEQEIELKTRKTILNIEERSRKVEEQRLYVEELRQYLRSFTIYSPADGMVIYKENAIGAKIQTGSSILPFENVVATLPDFNSMLTTSYISEVDINKISLGQKVNITIDAIGNKPYTGEIVSIANVGETLSNSSTKVFEVVIRINEVDTNLRPDMTTWNKIVINTYADAVSIPLDCVHSTEDGTQFVYKKNNTRQVVSLGEMNSTSYIVKEGLEAGTYVYIIPPEDGNDFKMLGI